MPNNLITHERMVGDTLIPITGKLVRNGAAVNLTGATVKFHMVKKDHTVVVNEASATVVDATAGTVSYTFDPTEVDEADDYYGWFIVLSGTDTDTFPHDGNKLLIRINNRPT